MKRILYIMIALCLTSFVANYSRNSGAIASEKRMEKKLKKQPQKILSVAWRYKKISQQK